MTPLRKNVTRKLPGLGLKGADLVVTLTPAGLVLRESGRRTAYTLPWSAAFLKAAGLEADRVDAERVARRRRRTVSRGLLAVGRGR